MQHLEPLNPKFKKALLTILPDKMPFWKLLGIEFVEVARGWAKMRLPFDRKLTNSLGIAHGGGTFLSGRLRRQYGPGEYAGKRRGGYNA